MADYKYWSIRFEDNIFWLYLNRPDKKNAFDIIVANELKQILDEEVEKNLNKIDIKWLVTLDESKAKDMTRKLQKIFSKFESISIPVIMAVKGLNLTAGFELMLCADIIIAADNARFGQVETKWGMTPAAGATQRLIRLVGPLKARDIIYTSRIIDAQEALKMGLVNEVVPLMELEDRVKEVARMMIQNSGRAIALCKRLIQEGIYNNKHGFQMEGEAFHELFTSGEPKERLKAFLEKK